MPHWTHNGFSNFAAEYCRKCGNPWYEFVSIMDKVTRSAPSCFCLSVLKLSKDLTFKIDSIKAEPSCLDGEFKKRGEVNMLGLVDLKAEYEATHNRRL